MSDGEIRSCSVRAMVAAVIGILIAYALDKIVVSNSVTGIMLDMLRIFVIYLYVPFEFSVLCLALTGFAVDLCRGTGKADLTDILLILCALALAYAFFAYTQEGTALIVSLCLYALRLVWRAVT